MTYANRKDSDQPVLWLTLRKLSFLHTIVCLYLFYIILQDDNETEQSKEVIEQAQKNNSYLGAAVVSFVAIILSPCGYYKFIASSSKSEG